MSSTNQAASIPKHSQLHWGLTHYYIAAQMLLFFKVQQMCYWQGSLVGLASQGFAIKRKGFFYYLCHTFRAQLVVHILVFMTNGLREEFVKQTPCRPWCGGNDIPLVINEACSRCCYTYVVHQSLIKSTAEAVHPPFLTFSPGTQPVIPNHPPHTSLLSIIRRSISRS